MARRVVILGIDGGTYDVIDPLIARGGMPRLSALLREGMRGTLASTVPPLTGPAWMSLLTGRRPENHGILGFCLYEPGTYQRRIASWRMARGPMVWDALARAGKTSGLVNVPMTWPPAPVRGFHVTGMFTPPGARYTHPSDLAAELEREFAYETNQVVEGYRSDMDRDRFVEDLHRVTDKHVKAALHLFETRPTDFFMLVLVGTDRLQHGFFHLFDPGHPAWTAEAAARYGGLLASYYERIDAAIGAFMDRLGPEDVLLLVSDHGFAPTYGRLKINRWLESLGWLAPIGANSRAAWSNRAWTALKKLDVLDLRHRLPGAVQDRLPRAATRQDVTSQLDWTRTLAYCPDPACRGIYINLVGRDPLGIVRPGDEYESLRRAIRQALLEVVVPGGDVRIFPRVWLREEVYQGTFVERAPDIVFDLDDRYNVVARLDEGPVFDVERGHTGDHNDRGMFAAWGSGVGRGGRIQGARIWDVAPTVLDLLGVRPAEDVDGRSLMGKIAGAPLVDVAGPAAHR